MVSLDYDGSGVGDLLIGAPGSMGSVYMFLGPLSGTLAGDDAVVSIEAATVSERLGADVEATSDLDGDLQPDFWVGAHARTFEGLPVGAALLFKSSELSR